MTGNYTIERCREVTEEVLHSVFSQLADQRVLLEGLILKANMVLPGLGCGKQDAIDVVAHTTITCLRNVVPVAVPGIAFLSGGQSGELASARLNAMNLEAELPGSALPWPLTFSFARAIQQPALQIWHGEDANRSTAQQALYHRAQCDKAALTGHYNSALEKSSAFVTVFTDDQNASESALRRIREVRSHAPAREGPEIQDAGECRNRELPTSVKHR